jgi:excisionase family DNA binding protein
MRREAMATVLTLEELAGYLRVHPSTIYRMLKRQEIPAFKVGSDWRFKLESIDRWRTDAEGRDPWPTTTESPDIDSRPWFA